MGYLFLAISLLTGATKGYCGKMTSGYVKGYQDAMLTNVIRMSICIVIGFLIVFLNGDVNLLVSSGQMLAVSFLSGVSTSVFVVCWLIAVQRGAYMMLDVFLMLGVLIPLTAGRVFFHETVSVSQWCGVGILLIAVYIMCSYNTTVKGKLSVSSLVLLTVCGIANGLTDFSQKLFVKMESGSTTAVFNFYTYLFSSVTLILFFMLFQKVEKKEDTTEKFQIRHILGYVLVMSVCLFANSFFKTLAANYLVSAVLYPLNQGVALILSTLMSAFLFHEKLTVKCGVGVVMAFAGLIVLQC